MDDLRPRLETLESQLHALQEQTQTVTRQLRWWRGLAGGLLGLAVLTWALPVGTAPEDPIAESERGKKTLEQRVAVLESLLKHFSRKGNEVTIKGANLHIVNGLGSTDCTDDAGDPIPDCPNGLGNLIVGYNELRPEDQGFENIRTGSHNVVVGQEHNFSRFGGLVVGRLHTISGDFASVSGFNNTASGEFAAVSGGINRTAAGEFDWVAGDLFQDE